LSARSESCSNKTRRSSTASSKKSHNQPRSSPPPSQSSSAATARYLPLTQSKLRKLKAEIYFRKIIGDKLSVSEFFRWVDSREENVNEKFEEQQEEDKFEYYYHLF
jgi:hypothetical protein